jgi:hypothetical protein
MVIRATLVAQTLAGRRIDIDVGYRRTSGQRVPLTVEPSSIPVEGGTRQVPVTVTIAPCLGDAERAPAGQPGCALDVVLRLRAEGGALEDTVRIVPSAPAQPGATIEPPSAQLFGAYAVTVRGVTGGAGNGAIISEPAGISCAITGANATGQCAATFSGRNPARFIATAVPGSTFLGWGAASGCGTTTGACTLTLTGPATLTPSFSQRREPLAVAVGGTGRGTVAVTTAEQASNFVCVTGASLQSCTRELIFGATAQLVAQPDAGNRFAGWGGACTGTGSCTVTMTTTQLVSANFIPDSASVAVAVTGGGANGVVRSSPAGIDCRESTGTCNARFPVGASVSLTAESIPVGFRFTGWGGACASAGTAPTCRLSVTGALSVTASFVPDSVPLTVTVTGGAANGVVRSTPAGIACTEQGGSCTARFPIGSVVALAADATPTQFRFVSWGGECTSAGATPTCRLTVTGATTVSAAFERVIGVTVVGAGTGTGRVSERGGITCTFPSTTTCGLGVAPGGSLVFTATPDAFNRFEGWSGLGATCGTSALCPITPTVSGTLTATFTRLLPTLVLTPRTLAFTDTIGRTLGAPQTVQITSVNAPIPAVSVLRVEYLNQAPSFLSVGALSGATPQSLQIAPAALPTTTPAGQYSARVLISAPGATNDVDTIRITRTIEPPVVAVGGWRVERTLGNNDTLFAVSGRSATDQMAVGVRTSTGLQRAVRFDGANWGSVENANVPRAFGVTAVPGGEYIAATAALLRRYTGGTTWVLEGDGLSDPYFGIHAQSITGVMAVGGTSTPSTNRNDGSQWRFFPFAAGFEGRLRAVWSFSQTQAIAVGDNGLFGTFSFGIWSGGFVPSSLGPSMFGIWAASPTNVIAVGEGGSIFRWNGTQWSEMLSGTSVTLRSVWGTGPDNIIAVGDGGAIRRYNGTTWTPMQSPTTQSLFGIWCSGSTDCVAVGANGVILRYSVP